MSNPGLPIRFFQQPCIDTPRKQVWNDLRIYLTLEMRKSFPTFVKEDSEYTTQWLVNRYEIHGFQSDFFNNSNIDT